MAQLFTRLLLATEHSEYDTGAEAMGFALARRCQLPLATVLPLVSNPEYEAIAPQLAAQAEREAAAKIAELRDQARAAGVSIDLHLRRGPEPYQEIVDEAVVQNSDVIIIRRRGKRSFLANLMVGEMVSKVVAHAPCHVLIVPREARLWQQRVLVAAEATAQGRQIVATGIAVAAQCGLPLHLVTVVPVEALRSEADAFVIEMIKLAQARDVAARGEVRVGNAYKEILAAKAACQADLIVMGSRGEARLGRAMVGGVAQKVMGLAAQPVLVLNFLMFQGDLT
ncbi:universal stress protein [Rhodoferax sp.]|uniref:universal stress protein n=1 Tax=Rhodoferax sp. TaxID=50421 RepID=UPI002618CF6F|nr:universal stress protein [Rhodoferax sp.]MDD2920598.1 universal stress protein [Rhodoferax sp.]